MDREKIWEPVPGYDERCMNQDTSLRRCMIQNECGSRCRRLVRLLGAQVEYSRETSSLSITFLSLVLPAVTPGYVGSLNMSLLKRAIFSSTLPRPDDASACAVDLFLERRPGRIFNRRRMSSPSLSGRETGSMAFFIALRTPNVLSRSCGDLRFSSREEVSVYTGEGLF